MNKNILNSINMRELGKELQQARSKRGLTQAEAAKIIDVARTTLTAIEKGTRRIKSGELINLARAYGRQVSDLVAARPPIESFAVQFRSSVQPHEQETEEIAEAVALLEELSRNYLELEQITGSPLVRKYPSEYAIAELPAKQVAEGVAQEERNRLGLGDGPIPVLRDTLEQDVGLRIFYIPMQPSSKFAGIYHYDDHMGGCIAVNVLHPEERRRWSLAHDYGHFLGHRFKPAISYWQAKRERFADYFAGHFLMPTSGLMRRYNDIKRTRGKITPADLLTLAHYYGVSFQALLFRLEEMKLLNSGARDKLQRGIKVREAQQQLGLEPLSMKSEKLPVYYRNLAVQAYTDGVISEGQLAKFLQVDRVEAREIAEALRQIDDSIPAEDDNLQQ